MKDSNDTLNDGIDNNNPIDVDIANVEKEMSIWTKVAGGPKKGRIYGFGSEVPKVSTHISSVESHVSSNQVSDIDGNASNNMETIHQKLEQERQERQQLENKVHVLEGLVQELRETRTRMPPSHEDHQES